MNINVCGSSSCIFGGPNGVATNAGCQCLEAVRPEKRFKVQNNVILLRLLLDTVTAERDECRKKMKELQTVTADSFIFTMSSDFEARLEALAEAIGGTKADVLLRGIALYEIALQARKSGLKLGVAEEGQELLTELLTA